MGAMASEDGYTDPYANLQYVRQLSRQGYILPMQTLLQKARPHVHGHIIESALEVENGQARYEIEYIDAQGRVHEVYFDASTGKPISSRHSAEGKSRSLARQTKSADRDCAAHQDEERDC